jgi:Flp pilus assembly protein TadG
MKRRSSDRERGVVVVLFSFALVCLLLAAGMVVDLGMAYVTRGRLTKAVDAGALAGARESSRSNTDIETIVRKVASANYTQIEDTSYNVAITTPATDTKRIAISAATESPAVFTRIIGRESFDVVAAAEAMRYPLDTSFVLDLSYSLERNDAFDDMQDASVAFLQNFDDSIDQFGLVTYSTWAEERMPLRKNFKAPMVRTSARGRRSPTRTSMKGSALRSVSSTARYGAKTPSESSCSSPTAARRRSATRSRCRAARPPARTTGSSRASFRDRARADSFAIRTVARSSAFRAAPR